jgi:hypothetical protein
MPTPVRTPPPLIAQIASFEFLRLTPRPPMPDRYEHRAAMRIAGGPPTTIRWMMTNDAAAHPLYSGWKNHRSTAGSDMHSMIEFPSTPDTLMLDLVMLAAQRPDLLVINTAGNAQPMLSVPCDVPMVSRPHTE